MCVSGLELVSSSLHLMNQSRVASPSWAERKQYCSLRKSWRCSLKTWYCCTTLNEGNLILNTHTHTACLYHRLCLSSGGRDREHDGCGPTASSSLCLSARAGAEGLNGGVRRRSGQFPSYRNAQRLHHSERSPRMRGCCKEAHPGDHSGSGEHQEKPGLALFINMNVK